MSGDDSIACTEADYEAACRALVQGQAQHGRHYKASGSSTWKALLSPTEFHDAALELARSIASHRAGLVERSDPKQGGTVKAITLGVLPEVNEARIPRDG